MSDRPGIVASRLIRSVEHYRSEVSPRLPQNLCKFTPSCSTYALEALQTRRTTTALAMIVWRLLRCNPLTRHHHHDPVARRRWARPRANSVRTASAVLLGTMLMLLVATAAFGQSISNGCSGSVNGSSPTSLTADSPAVVGKGESITVTGTGPSNAGGSVNGNYSISIVEGLFQVDKRNENWGGQGKSFQGVVSVDDYLKYGSGLYKVEGVATAASGWSCSASFYIKLDGSKIIGIVGVGIAALGGLGVQRASSRKMEMAEAPVASYDMAAAKPSGATAEEMSKGFGKEFVGLTEDEMTTKPKKPVRDKVANGGANGLGCLFGIIGGILGGGMALLFPISMSLPEGGQKRVWIKGRPVLGFVSGLVGGLGAAIALQQFGYWPLTTTTAIVFPIGAAIIGSLRAWRGTAYKMV